MVLKFLRDLWNWVMHPQPQTKITNKREAIAYRHSHNITSKAVTQKITPNWAAIFRGRPQYRRTVIVYTILDELNKGFLPPYREIRRIIRDRTKKTCSCSRICAWKRLSKLYES